MSVEVLLSPSTFPSHSPIPWNVVLGHRIVGNRLNLVIKSGGEREESQASTYRMAWVERKVDV